MIMHHHHLMDGWIRLSSSIQSGLSARTPESLDDEGRREAFLMGMFNLASYIAPRAAEEIDLSNYNHLLDMGGGPGTYAIYFCMKYPRLEASVYDLPSTRPFAERAIRQFKLTDRIRFIEGDYLQDKIEGSYDVVWLSHILHAEGPESCRTILQKAEKRIEKISKPEQVAEEAADEEPPAGEKAEPDDGGLF